VLVASKIEINDRSRGVAAAEAVSAESDRHPAEQLARQVCAVLGAERLGRVLPLLEEAKGHPPQSIAALHLLARAHLVLNDPVRALCALQFAVEQRPAKAELFDDYAETLERLRCYSAAEDAFRLSLKIEPSRPRAVSGLARLAARSAAIPPAHQVHGSETAA